MTVIAINAMILQEGRLSGIGHYIVQLITYFAQFSQERESPDRIIVLCRTAAAHHIASINGIEVLPIPIRSGRIARVAVEQLYLPRLLREERVHALLNPSFTGPTWGAPTIVTTVHDLYFRVVPHLVPPAQRLFLSMLVPFCCRRSQCIITPSASTMQDLLRYYPDLAGKISVIPLANRLSMPSTLPNGRHNPAPQSFVLLVAALTGNKNPEPLVAAISSLRRRYPKLALAHIGSDPGNRLSDAVERFQAHDWVTSQSGICDAQLAASYERCLCIVIPSLYEGFGLPLLEAQALGAPVVSSNRGSLPEIGGEGALYVDPTDAAQIAETIESLIVSPERRQALRRAGSANQARFSWERTARSTWEILHGAVPRQTDLNFGAVQVSEPPADEQAAVNHQELQ